VSSDSSSDDGPREVTVPLRTYKAVTVFSTLIAIIFVIFGFGIIDAATAGTGPLAVLFEVVGLPEFGGVATLVGVLLGLGFIGLGAGTYVLGTRFRTAGMGKAQDDSDEPSDNG
jgi:F0F1-type ATP synthase assembly protein I